MNPLPCFPHVTSCTSFSPGTALTVKGVPQVSFCDPESAARRRLPDGHLLSAKFQVSGAQPFVCPDLVQLQRQEYLADAADAAGEGPWRDVYALYRCLLFQLMGCDLKDFLVRRLPWCVLWLLCTWLLVALMTYTLYDYEWVL
jgi:hypothetical protein